MRGQNGYFQLEQQDDDTYIKIYPPLEGGLKVNIDELVSYLERNRITIYNLVDLKRAIDSQLEQSVFLLSFHLLPTNEDMTVQITEDKMIALVRFYPPYAGGNKMDMNDIINTLAHKGVLTGIQKEVIEQFLKERHYCTDYIVAKGVEPVQGQDAFITYCFDVDKIFKPTMLEDGSVDFFHLNNISHVSEGDVLARLTREVEGTPGKTVTGAPIAPRHVKRDKLRYGRNIILSEDKLSITSAVNGHVELVDDKVFVSDVYKVPGDVDVSTGDIEYEGNIEVDGNVRSGFTLKAKGDIIVGGVVEGATLIAGRDIVLKRGIQGMGKGYLEAKNDILVKFIENARVKAEGSISTESIMHSHVTAREQIVVSGKKGFVTGGYVAATLLVEAKTIGSPMGTETIISVGSDPDKKERYKNLQRYINNTQMRLNQLKPAAIRASKILAKGPGIPELERKKLQSIMKTYQVKSDELLKRKKEMEDIQDYIDENDNARVRVTDRIYPGAKVVISECIYHVNDVMHHCQYRKEGADVVMVGL